MDEKGKEHIKFKLATCFRIILNKKKKLEKKNKTHRIEDLKLVSSMRQLEADSGLSYTIIQTLSVGKRDVQFTSLIILLESLEISLLDFAKIYDNITEKQMTEEREKIEKNQIRKKRKTLK